MSNDEGKGKSEKWILNPPSTGLGLYKKATPPAGGGANKKFFGGQWRPSPSACATAFRQINIFSHFIA